MYSNTINNNIQNEIYTIDTKSNILLYAGNNQSLYIRINSAVSSFLIGSDSIIFCKLVTETEFVVVCYDGLVLRGTILESDSNGSLISNSVDNSNGIIYNNSDNNTIINNNTIITVNKVYHTHNDVSITHYCNNTLFIVADSIIHTVSSNNTINTIHCTDSLVKNVLVINDHLIISTDNQVLVCDNNDCIVKSMEYSKVNGIYCDESKLYVMRDELVEVYDCQSVLTHSYSINISNVHTMYHINQYLLLVNDTLKIKSMNALFDTKIENVHLIKNKQEMMIMSSGERVFIMDVRGSESVEKNSGIGIVYDMVIGENEIIVGGEEGINMIKY